MESLTYFKNAKNTPRKYRAMRRIVKDKSPVEAMLVMEKTNRKAAQSLAKILKSAITNAVSTLKVADSMLQFKLFTIEEGQKLRRHRAGSRGMAKAFNRRFSHVKIILTTKEPEPVEAAPVKEKKETKEVAPKATVKKAKKSSQVTEIKQK